MYNNKEVGGLIESLWMTSIGHAIRSYRRRMVLSAMMESQEEYIAYLVNRSSILDAVLVVMDRVQDRFFDSKWFAPYGKTFSVWFNDRREDLKEEAKALRKELRLETKWKIKYGNE